MAPTSTELASIRYIVDDVGAAVDFYTTHLGSTVNHSAAHPRSPTWFAARCGCCCPGRQVPGRARCPMEPHPPRVAGTASTSSSMTSPPKSSGSAPRV
jgi:hypothetical protein